MQTLLERDAELAHLRTRLAGAGHGRGGVVFVSGEAGIGKSSLVDALAAGAPDRCVVIGRCDALATPRALGPLLDVATALGRTPPVDRDGLLGCLVDAIRDRGPTLLLVEDAHWADEATIELLAMLGRRAANLPLLLVVTYREDEVTATHPLRLAMGDLVTGAATTWLRLPALSREAVRTLVASAGMPVDDVYERTRGNPFYVTEVLAAPGDVVPPTVRLAVLARAARFSPGARAVLDAVSMVPGRTERWLLDALGPFEPGALDECLDAGVLVPSAGTLSFRHELARLAIESQLGDGRRRALHERAVVALASRGGIDPARIAHHAEQAGDERALARASRDAGLLAASRTAHREAVRHGLRALELELWLADDDAAVLRVAIGQSLIALARADEAATLAQQAVDHWCAAGDERREAEALVALSAAVAALGRTAESMVPMERAIALLERYPPGRELAVAQLRLTSAHMLARDRDAAVAWGERAIASARQLGDVQLLARALIETGIADVMASRFDGLHRVRAGIALGRQRDLPAVVCLGLSQIGSGCGELRRYDDALPALQEGIALAAEHNLEANRRYQLAWLGRCHFDRGDWNEAESAAREALAGSRDVLIARLVALCTLGWLRARRGDPDAWPLLDEALEMARATRHLQRLWPVAVARAEAAWLEGDVEPHVGLLAEVFALAQRCHHPVAVGELGLWLLRSGRKPELGVEPALPFAAALAGDHARAAVEFRRLGCPYEVAVALVEIGGEAALREAQATFERLGAAPMAARATAALGARGDAGRAAPPAPPAPRPTVGALSEREVEVLQLVVAGFTNPQIAAALYISRKTAEHHVSNILLKLGVTSRTQAAAAAVGRGLLPGP